METTNKDSILQAYSEMLSWQILPSLELTKLMNVLITIINGEDEAQNYRKWFEKEKEHIFFVLEKLGDLEAAIQDRMTIGQE